MTIQLRGFVFAFVLTFIFPLFGISQTVANYSFTPFVGTFTALASPTTVVLTGSVDEGYANNIPIGFPFYYNSVAYSSVAISTNGYVSLGQPIGALNSYVNNLTAGTNPMSPRPILAPLWDDLSYLNTTSISYLTTGTTPNRVFTVQWLNARWVYNAGAASVSVQLRMFEADSRIEFVYRPEAGATLNPSASIGITNAGTGSRNFLCITSTSGNPTDTSTLTETTALNSKPANGQTYSFAPQYVLPAAPGPLNFTSVATTSMTLNWPDSSTSETYFKIWMGTDSLTLSPLATVYSNSTATTGANYQYPITGLLPGTTYYFQVFSGNEGSASSNFIKGAQTTLSGQLTGIKTICPTGCDYTTVGNAVIDIRSKGINGQLILELQNSYNANVEIYPLVFGDLLTNGTNAVTLRPASNVSVPVVFSSAAGITFDLNTTDYLTIDGKPGGTGASGYIQIANLNSNGAAVRFINDATYNTITDCRLLANTTSTISGILIFSNTSGALGNSYNNLYTCLLKDTAGTPVNGIYCSGLTASPNVFNTIYGNLFANIFNGANTTYGINVATGANAWFIAGNSFYQTVPRVLSANTYGAINLSSGSNYSVYGNYIGGSGQGCSGAAGNFSGTGSLALIRTSLATGAICFIQDNEIRNLSMNLSGTSQTLIHLQNGEFNISGNLLGSHTAPLRFSTTSTNVVFSPIQVSTGTSFGSVSITNNIIQGISVAGNGTAAFRGINVTVQVPELTVQNNLIGDPSNTQSIVDSTDQPLMGIYLGASPPEATISQNTICGLLSAGTAPNSRLVGINVTSSSTVKVSQNSITRLVFNGSNSGTAVFAGLAGIIINSSGSGHECNNNTIHSLFSTSSMYLINAVGIVLSGSSSGTSQIAANLVHSVYSNNPTGSTIQGIYNASSSVIVFNNRVRLGVDTAGGSIAANQNLFGISDAGNSNQYIHNSVFIGGNSVVTGVNSTAAFINQTGTSGTRSVLNNIFVNARSNGLGSGKHYAILVGASITGLNINNNIYFAPGSGGTIGRFLTTDYATLNAWRVATSSNYNSGVGDPNFVNANGSILTFSLKLQSPTPAEGAGVVLPDVTVDFEGDQRAANTPSDIGADAGVYVGSDIFAPSISYIPLSNTSSLVNRSLTARITDVGTGVRSGSALQPRIWFRRSSPTSTSWFSTAGVLVSGNAADGDWLFTIDYTFTGPPTTGQQFQYYVVAQDSALPANLFYHPFPNASHSNVNTQVTPPSTPFNFSITGNFPSAVSVGTGQTYTTLTGTTGLFNAINNSTLSGNTVVTIVSDISEPGTIALTNTGLAGYNLLIKPDATPRILQGSMTANGYGLITLNGARGVTIDGGASRRLTIRNVIGTTPATNTAPALNITSGVNDTVQNCIIESNASNTGYPVMMLTTSSAANASSGLLIKNNWIRPPGNVPSNSPATGIMINAVMGNLSTSAIVGNTIQDFVNYGIYLASTGNNITIGDPSDTLLGNQLVQTISRGTHYGVMVGSGSNHTIANNSIYNGPGVIHKGTVIGYYLYNGVNGITLTGNSLGGNSFNRQGEGYSDSGYVYFIYFTGGNFSTSAITGNKVGNLKLLNYSGFTGIYVGAGQAMAIGNTIGGEGFGGYAWDTIQVNGNFYGIRKATPSSSSFQFNTVSGIRNYGTGYTVGISAESGTSVLSGNIITGMATYGTTYTNVDYSCVGIRVSSAGADNIIENNQISNLQNLSTTAATTVTGIAVVSNLSGAMIGRNRITDLTAGGNGAGGNSPLIRGIYVGGSGSNTYANNQITLRPSDAGTMPRVRGIELGTSGGSNNFFYNTIYLAGVSFGSNNSAAFMRNTGAVSAGLQLRNNIFFNERSGSGGHYALSSNSISSFIHGHNLYVYPLTGNPVEYPAGSTRTLASWNFVSGNPSGNLSNTSDQLRSALFFPYNFSGDLYSDACRLSNAGIPVAVDKDYFNSTRSSAPDIGSIEFTSTSGDPSITAQPAAVNISCGPLDAQFTIGISGLGSDYQWEENRGSGWRTLQNIPPYSGVKTTTLTLSQAPATMNGYQYRCIFTGACLPVLTSSAVTLTISNTNTWTGSVSNSWGVPANWGCTTVPGSGTDVMIPLVANLPVISDTGRMCNQLNIAAGASLTLNSVNSQLRIYGGTSLTGNLINTLGTVSFNGSTTQTIPGLTYNNLTLNNAAGANLGGPVNVKGVLNLQRGVLDLGANSLKITGTTATIIGMSPARFIATTGTGALTIQSIGTGGRVGSVLFPVGPSLTAYNPLTFTNTGTVDSFSVRVMNGVSNTYNALYQPTGTAVTTKAVSMAWVVTEDVPGGSNVTLTPQWNPVDEQSGFLRSACYVSRFGGSAWIGSTPGAAFGANPFSQVLSGINQLGVFGVGSGGVLPVTMLSFSGIRNEMDAMLQWRVASEENVMQYVVERADHSSVFEKVGVVEATGNNSKVKTYAFTDQGVFEQQSTAYYDYRIRAIDIDGTTTLSEVIRLYAQQDEASLQVYPNPAQNEVIIAGTALEGMHAEFISLTGQVIETQPVIGGKLNTYNLPRGLVLLRITDVHGTRHQTRLLLD